MEQRKSGDDEKERGRYQIPSEEDQQIGRERMTSYAMPA